MIIAVAMCAGWAWRIVLEKWPDWQPVISLAGLFICSALTVRLAHSATCSKIHMGDWTFTCLKPHQEPAVKTQGDPAGTVDPSDVDERCGRLWADHGPGCPRV